MNYYLEIVHGTATTDGGWDQGSMNCIYWQSFFLHATIVLSIGLILSLKHITVIFYDKPIHTDISLNGNIREERLYRVRKVMEREINNQTSKASK